MKKTLITLLALGGLALGGTYELNPAYSSGTVIITLNVNEFAKVAGQYFNGSLPVLLYWNGSLEGINGNGDTVTSSASMGMCSNGSSGNKNIANDGSSTIYGYFKMGTGAAGYKSDIGLNGTTIFPTTLDMSQVTGIALGYSYNSLSVETDGVITGYKTNLSTTLAYKMVDGTIESYSYTIDGYVKSSGTHYKFTADELVVDDTYVNGVKYSSVYTGTADLLKATVASVPEPATATLSLLALAGLCARRRRH